MADDNRWLFVILLVALLASCGNALETRCQLNCPAGTHGMATNDRRGCGCVADVDGGDLTDAQGE